MARSIIVTGGAGFIGSHFVDLALDQGFKCIVLDALTYSGNKLNLESAKQLGGSNYVFVEGRIEDTGLVSSLLKTHKPDAIVHFAAESHVDRAIAGPSEFIKTNIEGTFNLLECVRNHFREIGKNEASQFRFIHISTDEVYGSLGETGMFSESTPYDPRSPYSASKAASDHLVQAWFHTYRIPTITTHCSNNYGPRQHPEKLIPHLTLCALAGKKLPVYGDGTNRRDWLHVKDHCKGILAALLKGTPGETYCFGGRNEISNIEIVRLICKILDGLRPLKTGAYESQIEFVTDRPGHDWRYAIDPSRAEKNLGFSPNSINFESQLKETVRWYLNNVPWTHHAFEKSPNGVKFDWASIKT